MNAEAFKRLDENQLDKLTLAHDRKALPFTLYEDLAATSTKVWLVKNLLGHAEASAFYGAPGAAKSALIEDMGLHIAAGLAWHGREVGQGAVLYIALERRQLVERRAIAFRKRHGIEKIPFAIMGGVFDFRDSRTAAVIAATVRLIEETTSEKVVLIIVDTVSRALAGGDENSSKDMGQIVTSTARLQETTGAHIALVHHVPIDSGDRLRGHGALLGALDTTVNVEKFSNELRTATVVKANDSEEGERIAFSLESIEIGPETTAPVVLPADPNSVKATKPQRRLSPRNKLALDALTEIVLSNGQAAPAEYQLAAGVKVALIESWRHELLRKNVIDQNGANPRTDFLRIREQLAEKNLIGCRDSFVWPSST